MIMTLLVSSISTFKNKFIDILVREIALDSKVMSGNWISFHKQNASFSFNNLAETFSKHFDFM